MKKIASLLLAIACVFALISCSSDSTLEYLVDNSNPDKIKTITTVITGEDTFHGTYLTLIDGNDFTMEYEYEQYATIGSGASDYIEVIEGVLYYENGMYSEDGENWSALKPSVANQSITLDLDPENFETYNLSEDQTELVSTLKPENSEKVLGRSLSATENIVLTVKTNGVYLTTISISYKSAAGDVRIDTSYSYDAQ